VETLCKRCAVNDLQFVLASVYSVWHRNRQRFTVRSLNRGIGNRTAGPEPESVRYLATPHGVCHESWMASGVTGQPILPQ
jgi:hypothetical protein